MAKVDDLINSVGFGDDGVTLAYPDTFLDDMRVAYADDMSIPGAKVAELTATIDILTAEIQVLKAQNYDLLTQVPVADSDESGDSESGDSDGSGDSGEDEPEGVDSLFDN